MNDAGTFWVSYAPDVPIDIQGEAFEIKRAVLREDEDNIPVITLRARVTAPKPEDEELQPYYEIDLPEFDVQLRTNYILNVEPVAKRWIEEHVAIHPDTWVFDTKIRVTPELEKAACKECGRA